jgi:threonyl-tRNA synthetase
MPKVTLPDGSTQDVDAGTPLIELLPPDAVAARLDGAVVDLSRPIDQDVSVEAVSASDPDGLHVLRHSTAHVMAQAVCNLYPGAKYAIGPPIVDGF